MTTAVQRPRVRTLLPIRIQHSLFNGHPVVTLEYEGDLHGQKQPFYRQVGPPLDDSKINGLYRDPLGVAVIQVMQMFWNLEAEVDGIVKERDEAQQQVRELKAQLVERTHEIHGLKSRLVDLEKNPARRK